MVLLVLILYEWIMNVCWYISLFFIRCFCWRVFKGILVFLWCFCFFVVSVILVMVVRIILNIVLFFFDWKGGMIFESVLFIFFVLFLLVKVLFFVVMVVLICFVVYYFVEVLWGNCFIEFDLSKWNVVLSEIFNKDEWVLR